LPPPRRARLPIGSARHANPLPSFFFSSPFLSFFFFLDLGRGLGRRHWAHEHAIFSEDLVAWLASRPLLFFPPLSPSLRSARSICYMTCLFSPLGQVWYRAPFPLPPLLIFFFLSFFLSFSFFSPFLFRETSTKVTALLLVREADLQQES